MSSADNPSCTLHALAAAAGVARIWQDVHGQSRTVSDDTLQALLDALGLECGSEARMQCSLRRLLEEDSHVDGRMIVAQADEPIVFRYHGPMRYRLEYEAGAAGTEGEAEPIADGCVRLEPVAITGYHSLQIGKSRLVLAVAPSRCFATPLSAQGSFPWGVAAQVYSLCREGVPGLALGGADAAGDYGALAEAARQAARQGASALAISPVHALFNADPLRYSPYAPSSRLFLNTAYIDVFGLGEEVLRQALATAPAFQRENLSSRFHAGSEKGFIDWPRVQQARLAIARGLFLNFQAHGATSARRAFEQFWQAGGQALQSHCLYETLHTHYACTLGPAHGWQDWPVPMRDPAGAAAQAFARQSGPELRFHAFMQWMASEGLSNAQRAAEESGMSIGLITDLAIGTDPRGSQAWGARQDILQGATVGAAPDLHHAQGQDWGLTAFSPSALRRTGFRPFLAMLRQALAHAGGVRIDHVLGLARMWLVPNGASAAQGAFLRYPLNDLLSLLALESHRHQAIVVGENLGTVPEDFNALLYQKGVLGTSVLWFEREAGEPPRFVPVEQWSAQSMATTTTHDLPTVAGWWKGTDLDWQDRLHHLASEELDSERRRRAQDKRLLVQALPSPPDASGMAPVPEVLGWVAAGPAPLCVFPLEDVLALQEQPNLPGSCVDGVDAHPNWLRRLPVEVEHLFESEAAQQAVDAIRLGRSGR